MKKMTISISLLVLAIFASGLSASAGPLHCTGLKFLEGNPGFSEKTNYSPIRNDAARRLTFLNPKGEEIVRIDLSEGDQYSFFDFQKADFEKLTQGAVKTIDGFYEDGFDWTNGYNLRARFLISCKI